jgi:serine/threonine protein kinase
MLLQMQWMLQLVDVVSYIHSFGRVHADLKADNIMLRENGRIVLNNWGLSYLVSETACKTGYRCASPTYCP